MFLQLTSAVDEKPMYVNFDQVEFYSEEEPGKTDLQTNAGTIPVLETAEYIFEQLRRGGK